VGIERTTDSRNNFDNLQEALWFALALYV